MRKPLLVALTGLALSACTKDPAQPPIIDEPAECDLDSDGEKGPGYPYDLATFRSTVWPALEMKCGTATGCHLSPSGSSNYNVFKGPDTPATCPDIQTFKELIDELDYEVPANSPMIKKLNGEVPHQAQPFAQDAILTTLTNFVNAANEVAAPPLQDVLFDSDVFASTIQPILDARNCATAGCHLAPDGQVDFDLFANPAAGSNELTANFQMVTKGKYIVQTLEDAEDTYLYRKMTDQHQPNVLSSTQQTDLAAWIQAGLDKVGEDDAPVACEELGEFNVEVFRTEILPMLEGDIDYNDINGGGVVRTGCARGPCHGDPSFANSPTKFYLDPDGSAQERAEKAINSFRCFVNVDNPTNSQLLLCPLNVSGCRSGERHPGEDIFEDVNDLNYQKLLSYIYAARAGNSPLDFAFFAKVINPIYSDLVCPDTNARCSDDGCHERQSDGTADGGSNFPMIPDAVEDEDLEFNFFTSGNFVLFNFFDANQSSLFLYPTNEIEDVDNNKLATGDTHPGGQCFAPDSAEALAIQKFAAGLRPNNQGFLQDFLVAGVFPASDVTDEQATPFNDDTVRPSIFEISGQSTEFNGGEWDGLFSAAAEVDLFEAFETAVDGQNQLAVAVAYLINTTGNEIEVVVTAASLENDLELIVNGQNSIGRDGQNATLTLILPPFEELDEKEATRVLLKVFQGVGDQTLAFTMNFADENDIPLTDETGELVIVLSGNNGGI